MQRNLSKILFIVLALCAFALGMKQLREPDIWWQLLSGRWMIEHAAITRTDMFSYTMQGSRWINVKWLYEVLIGFLEKGLGPEVVILLQAIVNVVIVWLLFKTIQSLGKYLAKEHTLFSCAIALLAFLAIVEYRMAGRPEMVSHLMCTLYMYIFWRNPEMQWKKIWWLVPLQCIWANMHEGYPVGMVMIAALTGGSLLSYIITKEKNALQQTGRILAVFAACALAILCNPNGIVLWQQPFEIYRQVWANKYTTELYSYKDIQYWTVQAKWHIAVLLLVTVYWVVQIIQVIKQQKTKSFFTPVVIGYLSLIPLFAYLSLTANRNIPFAQIVLIPSLPFVLIWITEILRFNRIGAYKALANNATLIGIVIGVAFYLTIVSNKFYSYTGSPNKYGIHISSLHNPTGAADFIKTHNIKGPAFSDYFVSSYLLWIAYPAFKSYIDLRDLDVFPVKFFDEYFSLYQQPDKFKGLDKEYNFNYVVLTTSQLNGIHFDLYWGEDYNLIYLDQVAAIYLKKNEANKELNSNPQLQKLYNETPNAEDAGWAIALTKLLNPVIDFEEEDENKQAIIATRYYNNVKNFNLSLKLLAPLMPALLEDADAHLAMGKTYMQYANASRSVEEKKRRADSAMMFINQALEINPDKKEIYSALGSLYAIRGDYESATENLHIFLNKDKTDDYMYYLYGFCNRMLWKKNGDADKINVVIDAMKNSVRLNQQNGKAYLFMAEAYYAKKENDAARKYLKEAIQSGNAWQTVEQQLLDNLRQQLGV